MCLSTGIFAYGERELQLPAGVLQLHCLTREWKTRPLEFFTCEATHVSMLLRPDSLLVLSCLTLSEVFMNKESILFCAIQPYGSILLLFQNSNPTVVKHLR